MKKRNTIQRQLVFHAVMALANHPTAEEVYRQVCLQYEGISKGTVYRNLNSLVEDGKLRRIRVDNAADRFDHTLKRHYHIECTNCHCFQDLDMCYMDEVNDRIAKETGFELESHDIVFHGLCPHCRQPQSGQQKKGA